MQVPFVLGFYYPDITSLWASSPIWVSEASRATTRELAAKPRGARVSSHVPLARLLFTISHKWRACSQATIQRIKSIFVLSNSCCMYQNCFELRLAVFTSVVKETFRIMYPKYPVLDMIQRIHSRFRIKNLDLNLNKNRRKAIFNWAAKGLFVLRGGGGYTHSGYHKTLSATIACNRISWETET